MMNLPKSHCSDFRNWVPVLLFIGVKDERSDCQRPDCLNFFVRTFTFDVDEILKRLDSRSRCVGLEPFWI